MFGIELLRDGGFPVHVVCAVQSEGRAKQECEERNENVKQGRGMVL